MNRIEPSQLRDVNADDASIISAAQVLLSLAPSQQQLSVKASTASAIVRTTTPTLSPKSTIVHHLQHQPNGSAGTLHDSRNRNTTISSTLGAICTPMTIVTSIPINMQSKEYPKILNVPQKHHYYTNGSDPNGISSCASSLDDASFDEQDDASSSSSSTSSSSNLVMLQPRLTASTTQNGTTSSSSFSLPNAPTTTISYRPLSRQQEVQTRYSPATSTAPAVVGSSCDYHIHVADPSKVKTKPDKKQKKLLQKVKLHRTKSPGVPTKSPRIASSSIVPNKPVATATSHITYYEGSVSLRLKEDELSLSPLHCFMRKCCVEAFTASAEEVTTPRYGKSHGRSISIGQVGIQCVFCKHRPYWLRQERAVCFPSTLKNIYHSIETWQRRHSIVCSDIPTWAKDTMSKLMGKSRSGAGGRRQYWEESAALLGMVDTPTGIRFTCPPGTVIMKQLSKVEGSNGIRSSNSTASTDYSDEETTQLSTNSVAIASSDPSATEVDGALAVVSSRGGVGGRPVVHEEDRELVTDFLFTLLNQMETCYFSEQDRVGGRSKVKDCNIGYPGLQCKHCGGKAGFGRYYPISIQALTSANSDRNIYNHVDKCRRCPSHIREKLQLHLNEQNSTKNRRGNRKLFFQRIWERMHGPFSAVNTTGSFAVESANSSVMEADTGEVDHHENMNVEEKEVTIEHCVSRQPPIFFQQHQLNQGNRRPPTIIVSNNTNEFMNHPPQVQQQYQNNSNNNNGHRQTSPFVVYSGYDMVPLQHIHHRQVRPQPQQQQQHPPIVRDQGQLLQELQLRYQRQPELWSQQQQHQQQQQQRNVQQQQHHRPVTNTTSYSQFYQS